MLDSKGLDPEQYMWNLWPRWDGIPFSDPQISDFAPDDHNAVVIRSEEVSDPVGDFLRPMLDPMAGTWT